MTDAPIRVLIVDDVAVMRSLLEEVIRGAAGFMVSGSARNVPEARIEVTRRRPDVVLLDEVLPGESSLDLLVELRSLGIPVVLVTGNENRGAPVPPGATVRLGKPQWKTIDQDRPAIVEALRTAIKNISE